MVNGGVLAEIVRAAPSILLERPQSDAAVERVFLERRLTQHETSLLEADLEALEARGRAAVSTFIGYLRLDLGLVCALEVILEGKEAEEGAFAAEVCKRAGFDPFPLIRRAAQSKSTGAPRAALEPAATLQELGRFIQSRLDRLNLQPFREMTSSLGLPREMHEILTLVDALRGAAFRHSAPLSDAWSEAIRLYREGKLEVAEAARLLQTAPEDLAFEFERRGVTRGLGGISLTPHEREQALRGIAGAAGMPDMSLRRRDLVASQRIEGIDARAHYGSGGTGGPGSS